MASPHFDRPICEPVELPTDTRVRVELIHEARGAAPTDSFLHFHDAVELVLFGKVSGHFDANDCRYALRPGSVAYIPSMVQHDFVLGPAPRDWVLLQIDGPLGAALARRPGLKRLRHPFCALPDRALHKRMRQLARWLLALHAGAALAVPLAELLLRAAACAQPLPGCQLPADAHGLQRLRPAIDGLLESPGHPPGLMDAASRCSLSPAYFSRRFKQRTGMSWTEYVRAHRLGLACSRLQASDAPIATISQDLGFATPSHFGSVFARKFGLTPREYRQHARVHSRPND